jgi:hypothetical protein
MSSVMQTQADIVTFPSLFDVFYTQATQPVCAMHWLYGWEVGYPGRFPSGGRGLGGCMLIFLPGAGAFFSLILPLCLFCLSGDDTMRHDTYLFRWRLQNTTTEQIYATGTWCPFWLSSALPE